MMKVCFALGGGGARGLAHVGVLKALSEVGIVPDRIVGTSMGAVIGAMYAECGDIDILERRIRDFIDSEEFDDVGIHTYRQDDDRGGFWRRMAHRIEELIVLSISYSHKGVFKPEQFSNALKSLLNSGRIEDLPLPFAAVAADLLTGEKVVFSSGDIITAVLASSSIPGFLPPVDYGNMKLCDGEVSDLVPSETARELGAEFIVAVDVRRELNPPPPLDNAFDILLRASSIRSNELTDTKLKTADVIIHPQVSDFHWTEFDRFDELYKIGYTAGESKIEEIRAAFKRRKRWFLNIFKPRAPR